MGKFRTEGLYFPKEAWQGEEEVFGVVMDTSLQ